MLNHRQIITLIFLTLCCAKLNEANVLFHFGFDFTVKDAESDSTEIDEHFNKTIELTNNEINDIDNTTGEEWDIPESLKTVTSSPISNIDELRTQQAQLNEAIIEKIASTKIVIEKLNRDLYPLVGRSDFVAAKVKLTTRYLNGLEQLDAQPKLEILEQFVMLVDELKAPPTAEQGGERTVEYVLMKLILEKHGVVQLQQQVRNMNEEVRNARDVWQRYIKLKLIEVAA